MVAPLSPTEDETLEYESRLTIAREIEGKVIPRYVNDNEVIWSPQDGSQVAFMQCSLFEALFHGTRGPGKTDALLMSFAQYVGKGFGRSWRGIIFRETYPQLADVQAKSEKWFRQMFKGAKFNRAKMMWTWPTGETLLFRHMQRPQDYWNYHGHEYPFIGWEEITNWADDQCFTSMISCCRSSNPEVPRMIRATTNPYGIGHNWVKHRYALHGKWWQTVLQVAPEDHKGRAEPPRVAIHGHISENKILLAADPDYEQTIVASATNPAMVEAWLDGSWDIVSGGMFDDVWSPVHNIVPRFTVPKGWRIDRAFDWGSSAPFSVGWYAQSDGSDLALSDGRVMSTVRGDLFKIKEWYGWNGLANQGLKMLATEVAKGIVEREVLWGLRDVHGSVVKAGPADSSIYTVENGVSIGFDMEQPVRMENGAIHKGVTFVRADKRPGSRKTGWEMLRKMMKNAHPTGTPRERPGLFIVGDECPQFIRTVPTLPRDEKDMDDVDTDAEDHAGDETRYRVRQVGNVAGAGRTTGQY